MLHKTITGYAKYYFYHNVDLTVTINKQINVSIYLQDLNIVNKKRFVTVIIIESSVGKEKKNKRQKMRISIILATKISE